MNGKYTGAVALAMCVGAAQASVQFVNASFETDSDWAISNDAQLAFAGGSAGWTWDTPVISGAIWQSNEDVFATDGDLFAITYAGLDAITQTVNIPAAGTYEISIDWNGVDGQFFSPDGTPLASNTGSFRLLAGGELSDFVSAVEDGGWQTFTWSVDLPAGDFTIGVQNFTAASYAIAYDNFRIVPAPGAFALIGLGACFTRRRRA